MLMAGRGGEEAQELYTVCQDKRGAPLSSTLTLTLCLCGVVVIKHLTLL